MENRKDAEHRPVRLLAEIEKNFEGLSARLGISGYGSFAQFRWTHNVLGETHYDCHSNFDCLNRKQV